MSVSLTVNGNTYQYPNTGDEQWGDATTNWATAVTNGMLQKAGGTFTLTADVNFGASFGLLAAYFSSRSANPSGSGQFRLANADTGIGWRNAANSGNLLLTVNSSNKLTFNGVVISDSTAYAASRALVTDASGVPGVSATTSTQIAYLSGATGTTGTTSANLVFSASPTFTGTVLAGAVASSSSNPASSGVFRLANAEAIRWRNAGNSANFSISLDSSNSFLFDAPILIPSGSASLPGLALSGDPDTGFYRGTTDAIYVSLGGVNVSKWLPAGIQWLGSSSAPFTIKQDITDSTGFNLYRSGTGAGVFDTNGNYLINFISNSITVLSLAGATSDATARIIRGTAGIVNGAGILSIFDISTNATNKVSSISMKAYTNSDAEFGIYYATATTSANSLNLGGGNSGITASTEVALYAAAAVNTTTGTKVFSAKTTGVTLLGTTTNDAAAAGWVGEYISQVVAPGTAWPMATDTFGDLASIALTAGDWDVSVNVFVVLGSAVSASRLQAGISSSSGTTTTGYANGDTAASNPEAVPAGGYGVSVVVSGMRVSLSGSATYYLKSALTFAGGTPNYGARISARRVR